MHQRLQGGRILVFHGEPVLRLSVNLHVDTAVCVLWSCASSLYTTSFSVFTALTLSRIVSVLLCSDAGKYTDDTQTSQGSVASCSPCPSGRFTAGNGTD